MVLLSAPVATPSSASLPGETVPQCLLFKTGIPSRCPSKKRSVLYAPNSPLPFLSTRLWRTQCDADFKSTGLGSESRRCEKFKKNVFREARSENSLLRVPFVPPKKVRRGGKEKEARPARARPAPPRARRPAAPHLR